MMQSVTRAARAHTSHILRKDKYQKKVLWFWVDTKYEGITRNAEEERLSRETGIGDALV